LAIRFKKKKMTRFEKEGQFGWYHEHGLEGKYINTAYHVN